MLWEDVRRILIIWGWLPLPIVVCDLASKTKDLQHLGVGV